MNSTGKAPTIIPVNAAYFVAILITLICLYCPITSLADDPNRLQSLFGILEVLWPLGLGLGMILEIRWLDTHIDSAPKNIHRVVLWMVSGWILMSIVALLLILHQNSVGVELYRPGVVISDIGIAGAAFGAIVGGAQVVTNDTKETLRSYKKAVENAGHCIYFTDTHGNIEWVNDTFKERTGYSTEEIIGRNANILGSGEHDDELFDDLWETIKAGEIWSGELINETQDGERVHVDQTIAPVFGDDGETIERYVAINSDITQIKEYESRLEQLNEQLATLNRVIRHDIRNDMAVVKGWAEILSKTRDEEKIDDAVQKIVRSSEHVIELTNVAKDFVDSVTNNDGICTEPTSLRRVLTQVIETRSESFPDAKISVDGEIPDVAVEANEMLSSVFRNLVNNAVQHNDKDTVEVTVEASEKDDTVVVAVKDNGPGVSDSMKEQIFGQEEKGIDSDGTGMGLYLVDKFVSDFDGDVWIEDNEPEGAVFVVELPLSTE